MKRETRKKRINLTICVLNNFQGRKHTINDWLEKINEELTNQMMYKNAKELAQAFRYIRQAFKIELTRTKESLTNEGVKYGQTCYELEETMRIET